MPSLQEGLVITVCLAWMALAWWLGRLCYRVVAFSAESRHAVTLEATNLVVSSSALLCWPLAVVLYEMGGRMGQGSHPILLLLFLIPVVMACVHLAIGAGLLSWVWRGRGMGFSDAAEAMLERFQLGATRQHLLLAWGLLGSLVFIQLTDLRFRMPTQEEMAFQAPSDPDGTMEWFRRGMEQQQRERAQPQPLVETSGPFSPWQGGDSQSVRGSGR